MDEQSTHFQGKIAIQIVNSKQVSVENILVYQKSIPEIQNVQYKGGWVGYNMKKIGFRLKTKTHPNKVNEWYFNSLIISTIYLF